MTFYDLVSGVLTAIGTFVLVYKTIHHLENRQKASTLEKLCTKWVIFVMFLKTEYWLLAIVEIIPLGSLALLVIKFLLFMPQNPISHKVYKKIQRKLEKVKMDEYHSRIALYLSTLCKHVVILMLSAVKKIAEYVNAQEIQDVESHIMDIITAFEYKKTAVHIRSQAVKSEMNRELNDTSFNSSTSEDEEIILPASPTRQRKTEIGQRMSKILTEFEDDKQIYSLHADLMIVKPNRALNKKARYEETKIEFYCHTRKITFTDPHQAVQEGTLQNIKWITKNMINLELILERGQSKVIKLTDKKDVVKWVEPVCEALEKHQS